MNKLDEIKKIYNTQVIINIGDKINNFYSIYKNELVNFKYVSDIKQITGNKYIRYIGFNNKLYYGGFLIKIKEFGNTILLYLLSTNKKVWTIDFNKNYVFMNNILNNNDKLRKAFENYLLNNK